jgi:hypothetical protein
MIYLLLGVLGNLHEFSKRSKEGTQGCAADYSASAADARVSNATLRDMAVRCGRPTSHAAALKVDHHWEHETVEE